MSVSCDPTFGLIFFRTGCQTATECDWQFGWSCCWSWKAVLASRSSDSLLVRLKEWEGTTVIHQEWVRKQVYLYRSHQTIQVQVWKSEGFQDCIHRLLSGLHHFVPSAMGSPINERESKQPGDGAPLFFFLITLLTFWCLSLSQDWHQ